MTLRGDLALFFGLLILLFVVWIGSGGPSRPISFTGPYLNPITGPGSSATAYGDPSSYSPISINGATTAKTEEASPYRGMVSLSRDVNGPAGETDYVRISVSASAQGAISTAGWTLRSDRNERSKAFPPGAEVARSGKVNDVSDIVLRAGDEAIIATGRSPIGVSFRENICSGYLEEHQDFTPSLQTSCPLVIDDYRNNEDDGDERCEDFLRGLRSCVAETDIPNDVSSSCESFVEDYGNYNGCVDNHRGDANFARRTWRIFLGASTDFFKNDHDAVVLLDRNGKVIDSFSY